MTYTKDFKPRLNRLVAWLDRNSKTHTLLEIEERIRSKRRNGFNFEVFTDEGRRLDDEHILNIYSRSNTYRDKESEPKELLIRIPIKVRDVKPDPLD